MILGYRSINKTHENMMGKILYCYNDSRKHISQVKDNLDRKSMTLMKFWNYVLVKILNYWIRTFRYIKRAVAVHLNY